MQLRGTSVAKFGKVSLQRLSTCHPDIQRVMHEVIKEIDIMVIEGHRPRERQAYLYASGRTRPGPILTKTMNSPHCDSPSSAVDIAPHPLDWDDYEAFEEMGRVVLRVANELGVQLRWGADWDRDGATHDERFRDYPHFELVR